MTSGLTVERRDAVLRVDMNRPDRLNAFTRETLVELAAAIGEAEADDRVRCLVLGGQGRAFCSGADASAMTERRRDERTIEPDTAAFEELVAQTVRRMQVVVDLHRCSKPTIASVNGPAAGGGVSLALACDYRVAAPTAAVHFAFQRQALPGDLGISFLLTGIVGPAKARELMMFHEGLDADEAHALGLWSELVPADSFDARVEQVAQRVAAGPTRAFAAMKEAIAVASGAHRLDAVLEVEARNTKRLSRSADASEGMQAFLEKRSPVFRGI